MKIEKKETVSEVIIESTDQVVDYLFAKLEERGVVCERANSPYCDINGHTYNMKSFKGTLKGFNALHLIYPERLKQLDTFDLSSVDYMGKIIGKLAYYIESEVDENDKNLFIFNNARLIPNIEENTIEYIVRMCAE